MAPSIRGSLDGAPLAWVLYERVGRGSFGSVFRGVHATTGEELAVKIIDLEDACVRGHRGRGRGVGDGDAINRG